jgi:hypothetical protein
MGDDWRFGKLIAATLNVHRGQNSPAVEWDEMFWWTDRYASQLEPIVLDEDEMLAVFDRTFRG